MKDKRAQKEMVVTRRDFLKLSSAASGLLLMGHGIQLLLSAESAASPFECLRGFCTLSIGSESLTVDELLSEESLSFIWNHPESLKQAGGIKIKFPVAKGETQDMLWTSLGPDEDGCGVKCWIYHEDCPIFRPGEEIPETLGNEHGCKITGRRKVIVISEEACELCENQGDQCGCILKPEITVHYPAQRSANVQRVSTFYRYPLGGQPPGVLRWKVYATAPSNSSCPDWAELKLLDKSSRPVTQIDAGQFERLLIFLPADVDKSKDGQTKEFEVALVAIDKYGNRCTTFGETVEFSREPSGRNVEGLPESYEFTWSEYYDQNNDHGIHVFRGVKCYHQGFLRIKVTVNGKSYYSNPCYVHGNEPTHRIYFGDLHFHSGSGLDDLYGGGDHRGEYVTPEETYRYAAEMMRLDFAAIADHDHIFRRAPDYTEYDSADDAWMATSKDVSEQIVQEFPGFVTFYAYEWTHKDNNPGHRVVIYKDKEGQFFGSKGDGEWKTLKELLHDLDDQPKDVLVIPHVMSPAYRPWSSSPSPLEKEYQKIGEVYSHKNNNDMRLFEGKQTQEALLDEHTYRYAWAKGYKIGVIGSTDNHLGQGGANDWTKHIGHSGGLAAVLAGPGTLRDKIWGGLTHRRTYATTGEKIYLRFSINGSPMGEELFVSGQTDLQIKVKVAVSSNIKKVRLYKMYKNNADDDYEFECIFKEDKVGWEYTIQFVRTVDIPADVWWMFYVWVKTDNSQGAWSSPIWIKG